jgi:hypothetical protein
VTRVSWEEVPPPARARTPGWLKELLREESEGSEDWRRRFMRWCTGTGGVGAIGHPDGSTQTPEQEVVKVIWEPQANFLPVRMLRQHARRRCAWYCSV